MGMRPAKLHVMLVQQVYVDTSVHGIWGSNHKSQAAFPRVKEKSFDLKVLQPPNRRRGLLVNNHAIRYSQPS
jgi:hypothetical protein